MNERQLVLYVQPRYSLVMGTVCGGEVLARLQGDSQELLLPEEFLPELEKNGQICKLDYAVWEGVCRMLKEWQDKGVKPYPLSVNLSEESFYQPQLEEQIMELLLTYQIRPSLLQLEITEDIYQKDPQQARDIVKKLQGNGFTVIMDNYGRGSTSLHTLKNCGADILKVDFKYLSAMNDLEKGKVILATMIKMASWIGMSVVAERVETRGQYDFAESAGCDGIQGFYYEKPLPQAECERKYVYTTEGENRQADKERDLAPRYNRTILVIDDSKMERELVTKYLQDQFHIHTCESAELGLAYLHKNKSRVHLILVDYMMPGMNGMEFLQYCQSDPELQAIPKIMITSNERSKDQIMAFRAGAYDYLTKPLVPEIVRARIQHVMDIHNQMREFENAEKKYRHQAELDGATGLLNKATFQNETIRNMTQYAEDQKALMIIDVDDFKKVNDQYGHHAGDEVLKAVADELSMNFRKSDLIGRFGGDEFIVLMASLPRKELARKKAQDVIQAVIYKCENELSIPVTISVGVAFFETGESFDEFFEQADQALYGAKNGGKGRAVVYGE